MARSRRYVRSRIILLQDVLISLLASLLAILFARWIFDAFPGFAWAVAKWLGVALLASLAGFLLLGSHKDVRRYATVRSMARALLAIGVKEVLLALALLTGLVRLPSTAYAVMVVLSDLLMTSVGLSYVRMSARMIRHSDPAHVKALASHRTALVSGTDDAAIRLADSLEKEKYEVVGFLTTDRALSGRVIADRVVYYCANQQEMEQLLWRLGGVDGIFLPRNATPLEPKQDTDSAPTFQSDGMSLFGHAVKRSFDIFLSSLLMLLFSPLAALCAILVKREDGGPVIFAQERIGREGKPFQIYKFRSMRVDAESAGSPALYSGEEDPRLTRTGRFLRAHHLDELPQLWNVFKGDMSFIGYRPERQYYIDQIMACNARYRYLFQIRPGITSYATLYNGYTDTLEKMLTRLDLDLYYLRNHSLWFDAKVLGLTFLSIVAGKKF